MKKAMKKVTLRQSEQEMVVDGQFMSEQDMIEAKYSETRRNNIKLDCQAHIADGWIRLNGLTKPFLVLLTEVRNRSNMSILSFPCRRDRYERDIRLYWVEGKISGRMVNLGLQLQYV